MLNRLEKTLRKQTTGGHGGRLKGNTPVLNEDRLARFIQQIREHSEIEKLATTI